MLCMLLFPHTYGSPQLTLSVAEWTGHHRPQPIAYMGVIGLDKCTRHMCTTVYQTEWFPCPEHHPHPSLHLAFASAPATTSLPSPECALSGNVIQLIQLVWYCMCPLCTLSFGHMHFRFLCSIAPSFSCVCWVRFCFLDVPPLPIHPLKDAQIMHSS